MSWRTKDDVLKDLGAMNGRRTGAERLDLHVVEGERPPPIRHEVADEDEINYFSGGQGTSMSEDNQGPDLAGISVMLKMVNNMDESLDDNESMTLYHNKVTDEIRISKLNPCAGEYIPGRGFNGGNSSGAKQFVPQYSNAPKKINTNMFKSPSHKKPEERYVNKNVMSPTAEQQSKPNESPEVKPNLLANGLPKRKIEKSEITENSSLSIATSKANEIKELQEKIKSTIIASASDNSLQTKRQKNVAIATLLKMGSIPTTDEPVKLIKPEYFQNPPSNSLLTENEAPVSDKIEEENTLPSSSSSAMDLPEIDPESISKVNGWFNNMESPKRKPQPLKPLQLKESITFRKKDNSSATSRTSDSSKEKKEPVKEKGVNNAFKPSSYADDLLKKYESNAQRSVASNEDLGTMLERQLKERDEVYRQKMLARQNAG